MSWVDLGSGRNRSVSGMSEMRVGFKWKESFMIMDTLYWEAYCHNSLNQEWVARWDREAKGLVKIFPSRPISIWKASYTKINTWPSVEDEFQWQSRRARSFDSFSMDI
jgi:hypothetical protein